MDERNRQQMILQMIRKEKIVAIVRGIPSGLILDTGRALADGGICMMEVTFDHSGLEGIRETLHSIALLKEHLSERMHIGAGTVLTAEEAEEAYRSGAEYIISPNVDRSVIEKTKELGLISMPGAFTPSEIVDAYNYGGDIIKLFPAGLLGVSYIKAVRGPLSHIPMAAVGGVTPENICQFTAAGVACFGIGSNLVNQSLTVSHDFENLTERALAFRNALGE